MIVSTPYIPIPVGATPETFKVTLSEKITENTTQQEADIQRNVEILSGPKHKYSKWHHKILNKLTFGKRFNEGFEYIVILKDVKIKWGIF
jgi:hypothetical protein